MFIAREKLMLKEDGTIIRASELTGYKGRTTLLVAEGGELSQADAIKYGLMKDPRAPEGTPAIRDVGLPIDDVPDNRQPGGGLSTGDQIAAGMAAGFPTNIGGANEASKAGSGPPMDAPPKTVNTPPATAPVAAPAAVKPAAPAPAKAPAPAAPAPVAPVAPPATPGPETAGK